MHTIVTSERSIIQFARDLYLLFMMRQKTDPVKIKLAQIIEIFENQAKLAKIR